MKRYRLKVNKTKMVNLLCSMGYKPTVKRAKFEKLFREHSYWLSWFQSSGCYEAHLFCSYGRGVLCIDHDGDKLYVELTNEELDQYNMKEEIK